MKTLAKKIIIKLIRNTDFYKQRIEKKHNQYINYQYLKLKKTSETPSKEINVINLNANDICNSKCVMCNIWEQKKGFEFSPEQLKTILHDDLFKNVEHIGVTGGEPTMREDLPDIYEAIIDAIPNIKGVSTITNCIKENDVKDRIEKVAQVCQKHKKPFSMMVSLDGFGEVHDKIRGREGNFKSAINIINHFKERGIEVSTGSTISKDNLWEIDELLDYMKKNSIYGRFRVAEFIKRLYNENKSSVIRNFDDEEAYHLILFFYKLIFTFEKNETYKRTYKSIINILAGGERLIGCPYQNNGVVLNSRGELAFCAPKSEIIGSTLDRSAIEIYNSNSIEHKRILKENCKNCIHDYHAPITAREYKIETDEQYWKRRIKVDSILLTNKEIDDIPTNKVYDFQVFITGWYGTETVGDKAILAGIIQKIKEKYSNSKIGFIISSLYPLITERTMKELEIIDYQVVSVYSEQFISSIKGANIVIMGGGPLMDLEELALPLLSFKIAKKLNIKSIIFGCGLGPLFKNKYIKATKEILNLADEIHLRDQKSILLAKEWTGGKKEIELSGDPAKFYLQTISSLHNDKPKINRLSCFLREWTHEYIADISFNEFLELKKKVEYKLSEFIKSKAEELKVDEIYLDHMHNFVIGNDDRDFSRYFIQTYFKDYKIPIVYNKKLSTVESIVENMKTSQFNICMRFHSVVFAHTLDTNFIGFDYTNGGKINNYLSDNHSIKNLLSLNDLLKYD